MDDGSLGEDFAEQAGQFTPLGIGTAATDRQGTTLQPCKGFNLDPQLGNGAGGSGLVENFFLGGFDFVVRRFIQVLNVFAIKGRKRGRKNGCKLPAPLEHFQFP